MKSRAAVFAAWVAMLSAVGLSSAGVYENLMKKGGELRTRGQFSQALKEFQSAKSEATRLGDRRSEAQAMIELAQVHQDLFATDTADKTHFDSAVANYESAIKIADSDQASIARNNLGTLYLKNKDYHKAVGVLKQVDRDRVRSDERFIYDYNLGRASDLARNPSEAYRCYLIALGENPKFAAAAEKAYKSLRLSGRPDQVAEAARLSELLLENAQGDLVGREILKCLDDWGDDPKADRLLIVLVRCYTMASLSPDRFRQDVWPALSALGARRRRLASPIDEILFAFLDNFPPLIQREFDGPVGPFFYWSSERFGRPGKAAFSAMLKKIGDCYDEPREGAGPDRPRLALARYAAAWSIDPLNTEAALFIATMLRNHPELDRDRQFYERFIDALFDVKNNIYRHHPRSSGDWANLMRMHYLLGTIFEAEGRWGNEDEPRSAIFQWDHARKAEEKLRELDPKYPPTPGLYQHLGLAYELTLQFEKAIERYRIAARGFTEVGDVVSASEATAKLRALGAPRAVPEDKAQKANPR